MTNEMQALKNTKEKTVSLESKMATSKTFIRIHPSVMVVYFFNLFVANIEEFQV